MSIYINVQISIDTVQILTNHMGRLHKAKYNDIKILFMYFDTR